MSKLHLTILFYCIVIKFSMIIPCPKNVFFFPSILFSPLLEIDFVVRFEI